MFPDDEQLHALLAAHDPRCTLVAVSQPSSGLVNRVLFISTSRAEYVLKVFDDLAGSWKPQKERALFDHMRTLTIPTPRVYRVDATKTVVPFSYSLTERCPGVPFSVASVTMSEAAVLRVYSSLGDYLGRLHATTFDQFGDVGGDAHGLRVLPLREWEGRSPAPDGGPFSTWDDMHRATMHGRLRFLQDTVFADVVPAVERFFNVHAHLIDVSVIPRLLHMDLHAGNVLVHDGRVSAILDVEEAVVGHNEYDLMRTELAIFRGQSPERAAAFLRAYQRHVPIDEGYEARKDLYDVSRTLVWMKSLVMYGDNYARGAASHSHEAARAHLRWLLSR